MTRYLLTGFLALVLAVAPVTNAAAQIPDCFSECVDRAEAAGDEAHDSEMFWCKIVVVGGVVAGALGGGAVGAGTAGLSAWQAFNCEEEAEAAYWEAYFGTFIRCLLTCEV